MTSRDDLAGADPLDRLIDAALRSEPLRTPPAGLFLEIQGRVRVAAVVQKVRRRIWFAAGAWLAGGAATAVSVVFAARGLRLSDILVQAFPGGLGYADYLTSFYAFGPASATVVLLPVSAAAALLAGGIGASWVTSLRQAR